MTTLFRQRILALGLAAITALGVLHAPSAHAHWRGGGWFVGGLVVGAALAPRYVYSAPVYWSPPPVVYSAPPPVVYTPPPVVYTTPAPVVVPSPPITISTPAAPAPQPQVTQTLSFEERLRRLRSLCDQGLLSQDECRSRREQILREL